MTNPTKKHDQTHKRQNLVTVGGVALLAMAGLMAAGMAPAVAAEPGDEGGTDFHPINWGDCDTNAHSTTGYGVEVCASIYSNPANDCTTNPLSGAVVDCIVHYEGSATPLGAVPKSARVEYSDLSNTCMNVGLSTCPAKIEGPFTIANGDNGRWFYAYGTGGDFPMGTFAQSERTESVLVCVDDQGPAIHDHATCS